MNRSIILLAAALTACTASKPTTQSERPMTADSTATAPADDPIDAANEAFRQAFAEGEIARSTAHYAPDGVWYLTNGVAIAGRELIEKFLARAHADGAGAFEFSSREIQPVGEHRYTSEKFAFDLAPGTTVTGTRYGLWSQGETGVVLHQDVWVPDGRASAELTTAITAEMNALAKAYNDGDAGALRARYAVDGTMVLSSGAIIGPDDLGGMLEKTAAMGIDDMRFGEQTVYAAGEAAYALGSFDVTLPTPDGDVPLSGTRLTLWRRNGEVWQIALELSWPRTS